MQCATLRLCSSGGTLATGEELCMLHRKQVGGCGFAGGQRTLGSASSNTARFQCSACGCSCQRSCASACVCRDTPHRMHRLARVTPGTLFQHGGG